MAYTTINKSSDYFNTKLYTGNGSTQSITGVGFQPDWVWTKERSGVCDHHIFDVLRGATYKINSASTEASSADANTLTSFDLAQILVKIIIQIHTFLGIGKLMAQVQQIQMVLYQAQFQRTLHQDFQ